MCGQPERGDRNRFLICVFLFRLLFLPSIIRRRKWTTSDVHLIIHWLLRLLLRALSCCNREEPAPIYRNLRGSARAFAWARKLWGFVGTGTDFGWWLQQAQAQRKSPGERHITTQPPPPSIRGRKRRRLLFFPPFHIGRMIMSMACAYCRGSHMIVLFFCSGPSFCCLVHNITTTRGFFFGRRLILVCCLHFLFASFPFLYQQIDINISGRRRRRRERREGNNGSDLRAMAFAKRSRATHTCGSPL